MSGLRRLRLPGVPACQAQEGSARLPAYQGNHTGETHWFWLKPPTGANAESAWLCPLASLMPCMCPGPAVPLTIKLSRETYASLPGFVDGIDVIRAEIFSPLEAEDWLCNIRARGGHGVPTTQPFIFIE